MPAGMLLEEIRESVDEAESILSAESIAFPAKERTAKAGGGEKAGDEQNPQFSKTTSHLEHWRRIDEARRNPAGGERGARGKGEDGGAPLVGSHAGGHGLSLRGGTAVGPRG